MVLDGFRCGGKLRHLHAVGRDGSFYPGVGLSVLFYFVESSQRSERRSDAYLLTPHNYTIKQVIHYSLSQTYTDLLTTHPQQR